MNGTLSIPASSLTPALSPRDRYAHASATAGGKHKPFYFPPKIPLRQTFTKTPSITPDVATQFFVNDTSRHASAFVEKNHRGQFRKGTDIPYVFHARGVAAKVMNYLPPPLPGTNLIEAPSKEFPNGITRQDAYCAALMHDLIEDQGGKTMENKIRAKFGDTVVKLVLYCTDLKTDEIRKLPYNERKRRYLRNIASGPSTAVLIAAADKLDNLELSVYELKNPCHVQPGQEFWDKFGPKRDEKLQYYRDVIDIFRATGRHPEIVDKIESNFNQLLWMIAERSRPRWLTQIIRTLNRFVNRLKLIGAPKITTTAVTTA